MGDGGNTCPEGPKMTFHRRWLQLRWKTVGQIQWRMEMLTGNHAWLRRQSPSNKPIPEPQRRPTGFWFWTKHYAYNLLKAYEWRLKRMTGYYKWQLRLTAKELNIKLKTEITTGG